jgi:hypothetical protein
MDNVDILDITLETCKKHKKIKWKEKWQDFGKVMETLMSFNVKHYDIDASRQKCPECLKRDKKIKKPS